MKNKIIVANWKLNPDSPREAMELFNGVKRVAVRLKKVVTVLCPPVIFLPLLAEKNKPNKRLFLGAQDAFWANSGAWTGQIGPAMVRKGGGSYVILGHSERRALGDSDGLIRQKLKASLLAGLQVILCVGEKERDEQAAFLKHIERQINLALEKVPSRFASQLIVAYEPVWAVGAKARSADTPRDFLQQAIFIRRVLSHWCGHAAALKVPVLYGGSVDQKNAGDFLAAGQADGLLVGRASLRADQFNQILKLADALA